MQIEYKGQLPLENKRFECFKCGSRFVAEGEGDEWFVRSTSNTLGKVYIAYCPICGSECRTN